MGFHPLTLGKKRRKQVTVADLELPHSDYVVVSDSVIVDDASPKQIFPQFRQALNMPLKSGCAI